MVSLHSFQQLRCGVIDGMIISSCVMNPTLLPEMWSVVAYKMQLYHKFCKINPPHDNGPCRTHIILQDLPCHLGNPCTHFTKLSFHWRMMRWYFAWPQQHMHTIPSHIMHVQWHMMHILLLHATQITLHVISESWLHFEYVCVNWFKQNWTWHF